MSPIPRESVAERSVIQESFDKSIVAESKKEIINGIEKETAFNIVEVSELPKTNSMKIKLYINFDSNHTIVARTCHAN